MTTLRFSVLQIGAREHYAVARALFRVNALQELLTDLWVPPSSPMRRLPGSRRLQDRFHSDLKAAPVTGANFKSLSSELYSRFFDASSSWDRTLHRNDWFQRWACTRLLTDFSTPGALFAYSYAARSVFSLFRSDGYHTVLGQIDPGLHEEQLVVDEHRRYHYLESGWRPAPGRYWDAWHEELELSDSVVVNSQWSLDCLHAQGVPLSRLHLIPLVFEPSALTTSPSPPSRSPDKERPFQLLFLGTICLRKGIGRLLDAMRLLINDPVELTLAGPTEIDPQAWTDVANVRWIGPVPRSAVEAIYRNADAMILPTLSDGFALTQLEALSYGCPVIASRFCGDVVRPGINGWLLDDLEPQKIAEAICAAVETAVMLPRPLLLPDFSLSRLAQQLLSLPRGWSTL